ncbi:MAG: ATP synthase F1 subunit gamma [Myxococcales bacterium]|nr:ATP synthase F1 subunit gamma [Myxococcales bacterium]MCB9708905.1 ATP synthase F1 subunit gamma [Myxococcales bacterium]
MSGLKIIRKRISSVKNTQKITKAMKMVAAARLRKAQQRILELRPYALETKAVLASVAARAGGAEAHPLLATREEQRVLLVILTSDRGLAGAFSASINKAAYQLLKRLEGEGKQVSVAVIGRKGRDYFARRGASIRQEFRHVFDNLTLAKANEIGQTVIKAYAPLFDPELGSLSSLEDTESVQPELDAVYLIYNEFKSAITQQVVIEPLLPVKPEMDSSNRNEVDFIYEPNKRALLDRLISMYVQTQIFRALLESVASEHGARMTAMDNATRNASDMIDRLSLKFNRARQAAITKELMEIIGGAEALK